METKFKILLLLALLFQVIETTGQQAIYVAPDGDDNQSGALQHPMKSLQLALDKAAAEGIPAVLLRKGIHFLEKSIELTPEHSGLKKSDCNGEKAILSGCRKLDG